EDAVDDLSHRPCTRPSRILRSRQVGRNHAPFLIGHVGLVSVRLSDMLHSSGWGPHGVSGVGLSNPLESRRCQPLNLFRNGLLANSEEVSPNVCFRGILLKIKEEMNEHGKSPESKAKAQEGRDLRNEGRVEDGKAPKTTKPGTGHPEK